MRYLTLLLLIPALSATGADSMAQALSDFQADIEVTVTHDGTPVEGAVIRLDLNNNGIWEEHLGESQAVTGVDGIADFGQIVSIQNPGGDDPAEVIDWHPARILTGNLRGAVGAHEVQFDFVLPAGVGRASLGLYDLRGRRLAGTGGVGDLAMDVPGSLPSGVYFVRLSADPAASVVHRITSVGQRAQTVRARQVSAVEAVAAGWVESRTLAGAQKSRDEGHPIAIMVSHVEYGGMNQAEAISAGLNGFTVAIPVSPEGFISIPPGTFTMGSPEDEPGRVADRETQHQVTLTQGFYMSRYEVTEQWWHQVMGGSPTDSQLPEEHVKWDLAVQFCNALSAQEGLTPAYTIHGTNGNATWDQSANGYRLPTEAEWEYACRATTTPAFSNNTNCLSPDTEANYDGYYPLTGCPTGVNRGARTDVGSFPANPWGLYDMHGNVYEWVWCGSYRQYTADAVVDPVYNVGSGVRRVLRGGGYPYFARNCRSAYRYHSFPTYSNHAVGFRPVRTAF